MMTPKQEARFRETSAKIAKFGVSSTRMCPGCNRTRSAAQFDDGKKTCKKCRGITNKGQK